VGVGTVVRRSVTPVQNQLAGSRGPQDNAPDWDTRRVDREPRIGRPFTMDEVRLTSRPYASARDLRAMQAALAAAHAQTHVRIGDLAWRARFHTHRELSLEIRLWESCNRVVGWTWFRTRGGFDLFIDPEHRDGSLLREMLDVVDEIVGAGLAAGDVPGSVYTFFLDEDEELAAALRERGYEEAATSGDVLTRELRDVAAPELPSGYRLGWVASDADVLARVTAHQAAFAPSDLSYDKYVRVRGTWPYRAELDRVALAADGSVAAFCTAWLDEQNASGLFEPVGTHPDHRRRGLATAVCLDALRALRDAGARTAQVGTGSAAGRATYLAAGFRLWKREVTYRNVVGESDGVV
jgi:GNAT superfamily N-acetyltransferase